MNDGAGCSSDYTSAGSAAAQAVTGDSWSYTRGVMKRFPSGALLLEVRAQACIAVPLLDREGKALGAILAAFRRPLTNTRLPKSILEAFAPRAAAELRRKQAEAALRESEQRYHAFISQNADAMWRIEFERPVPKEPPEDEQVESVDRCGYMTECNYAMARLFGYNKAEQAPGRTEYTREPSFRYSFGLPVRHRRDQAAGQARTVAPGTSCELNGALSRTEHWCAFEARYAISQN